MAGIRERLLSAVGPLHDHLCRLAPCVLTSMKGGEENGEAEEKAENEAKNTTASGKTRVSSFEIVTIFSSETQDFRLIHAVRVTAVRSHVNHV